MKNLKEKVKNEFESQIDNDLHFDSSTLQPNPKSYNRKRVVVRRSILITASAVLCLVSIPIISSLEFKNTFRQYKKQYTQSQLMQVESNSFKKLNNVTYPTGNQKYSISEEYYEAVTEFANRIYPSISQNEGFSPLNLHMNLSILSLASDDEIAISAIDSLLGMTKETREADFINAYKSDYFYNDNGTIQMYNGYFASNKYENNPKFISSLTKYYTEAYQVDFDSDFSLDSILEWIDQKVQDSRFLRKEDLDIKDDTIFLLASTLYFKNSWKNVFDGKDTIDDVFYIDDVEIYTSYMSHSYYGDCYDYDDYISCYDYYNNGLKIKYLIPKTHIRKSIFELTKEKNIFIDDEARKIMPESSWMPNVVIDLKVPKFKSESMIDFSQILKDNGLDYLFNEESKSFNYVFNNLPEDVNIYLDYVKQKNYISFDEDGTTIKSVTYSGARKNSSSAPMTADTIEVNLNRPFIYVIYDSNDLPIFVGNVNNPKK